MSRKVQVLSVVTLAGVYKGMISCKHHRLSAGTGKLGGSYLAA